MMYKFYDPKHRICPACHLTCLSIYQTNQPCRPAFVDRAGLQAYLESRGFAVYDHESTDDLRRAAWLQDKLEKE